MKATRMIWYAGVALAALVMLAASATAAAQLQARTARERTSTAAADSSRMERQRAANLKHFRGLGIAAKLHTTPEALAGAYERARVTNPRLSRGQFVAAHVLATNLNAKHPSITAPAMLSGLEGGWSIGQTLRNLGLSASQARVATRTADRQRKEAVQRVKAERKTAKNRAKYDPQGNRPGHR